MQADQKLEPQARKIHSQIPSREKLGDRHFCPLLLHWASGIMLQEVFSLNMGLKLLSWLNDPMELKNAESRCLSELVIWGPVPWMAAAKSGVLYVWYKPVTPQGGSKSWGFPPDCKVLCLGEVYGKSVSQSFLPVPMQVCSQLPNV